MDRALRARQRREQWSSITSPSDGTVKRVLVGPGDPVKVGQALIEL